ncbi:MAG: 16S rRNA (cytosine(1402)-N(4))-methyltransferase RsmH, partial [Oscillospiraceae bacterium]
MSFEHIPVLLHECIDGLSIKPSGIYVDGTAGGGGHSYEISQHLTTGMLYSLDQDPDAIAAASLRLAGQRAKVVQTNFRYASSALSEYGVTEIDGALLDLGVSSYQLDEESRGFSYKGSAPLDMRMSQSGISAADIVNSYTREELAKILKEYGEEPYAWYIAGKIVAMREINPLTTTDELVRAIVSALPASVRRKDKNPARRSFQALRIAVNGEMDALSEGLDDLFSMLKPGGRLAIITFHSLEDRIVKQRFKAWATACTCPPEFPVCVCGGKAKAKLITKKPIEADTLEQEDNRRARSAKLRVAE